MAFQTNSDAAFLANITGLSETAYDITCNVNPEIDVYSMNVNGTKYDVVVPDVDTGYFVLNQIMKMERESALLDGEWPACIPNSTHTGISIMADWNIGNNVTGQARRMNGYNQTRFSVRLHDIRDVIRGSSLYDDSCKAYANGVYNEKNINPLSKTVWDIICAKIDSDIAGGTTRRLVYSLMADDNNIASRTTANIIAGDSVGKNANSWAYLCKALALKYPQCNFITSYYITSAEVPYHVFPSNVGIMLTTYGAYRGNAELSPRQKEREGIKNTVYKIFSGLNGHYDYVTAFRDHMRIYPVMTQQYYMVQALKYGNNVKFLIINGADYSREFLGALKMYLYTSALYNDSAYAPERMIKDFFNHYQGGALAPITYWYLSMEEVVYNSTEGLHMYQTHEGFYDTQWSKVDPTPVLEFLRTFDYNKAYERPFLAWDVLSLWMMTYKANWTKWLKDLKTGTIGAKNFKPEVHSSFDYAKLIEAAFRDTDGVSVHTWLENFRARYEQFKEYLQEDTIGFFDSYAYKWTASGFGTKYLSTGVLDFLLNWTTGHESCDSTGQTVTVTPPSDFAGHKVRLYFENLPNSNRVPPSSVTIAGTSVEVTVSGVWATCEGSMTASDVITFSGTNSKLSGVVCLN